MRRGHWADRLPAIDNDVAAVEKYFAGQPVRQTSATKAIRRTTKASPRPVVAVDHAAPAAFTPGSDLRLTLAAKAPVTGSTLWYRHVNQAERWLTVPMEKSGNVHSGSIPGSYTNSPYPLQYYFEIRTADAAVLHPAFNATLSNQPYYAVMSVR